jgi:hypothetical protein
MPPTQSDGAAAYDWRFLAGIRYHYLQRYWESHMAWESYWLEAEGEDRRVVQALIIAGAACIHALWGRWQSVRVLVDRCREKLTSCPARYHGLDLVRLAADLVALGEEAERRRNGGGGHFDLRLVPALELDDVDRDRLMADVELEILGPLSVGPKAERQVGQGRR